MNIGTNDLSDASISPEQLMEIYGQILDRVKEALPNVEIYLMAYYPVNYDAAVPEMKECLKIRTNEKIAAANELVKMMAQEKGARFIDINAPLKDAKGCLRVEYTIEGMHIKEEGYRAIYPEFMKYVTEPSWK